MITLSDEQQRQLNGGQAVDVIDSETEQAYVVLRKDIYERVRQLIESSEWTEADLRLALARSFQGNGWDEPEMDAYDHYDEELRKRCP